MAFRGISYNNLPIEIIIIKCPETNLKNKVKWHKNKKKEIVKIKSIWYGLNTYVNRHTRLYSNEKIQTVFVLNLDNYYYCILFNNIITHNHKHKDFFLSFESTVLPLFAGMV